MAPRLGTKGNKKKGGLPAPVAEAPPPAAAPSPEQQQAQQQMAALARHMPKELREALIKVRAEVEKNCEHVGDKFAEEARKIHYGESDKRGIYGETSDEEAEALAEEGIEFGLRQRIGRARAGIAAGELHYRDLGDARCRTPAVERQGQRVTHADIIERLAVGIERQHGARKPRRFEQHGVGAQLLDQAIELVQGAELDGQLALLAALGALLDADLHLGGEQVRELLLQAQHIAAQWRQLSRSGRRRCVNSRPCSARQRAIFA